MVITTHKHMQTETAFNFWAAFHSFFFFFEKLLLILERVHRAHIDVNDKSFALLKNYCSENNFFSINIINY